MHPNRRVTLKDIAAATGLSVAAVSKALRGLSDISPETRDRVQAAATRMGYERDAALGALAAYRTKIRDPASDWNAIAFLHNWPDFAALEGHAYYRHLIERLREELTLRGFSLEIHSVGVDSESCGTVLRQLKYRGVLGLILGPLPPTPDPKPIQVERGDFEVMTLGPTAVYARHHTVQADFWENFQLLWGELRARDYKRIGLYLPQNTVWRTGGAWLGGYLEHQHEDRKVAAIAPLLHGGENRGEFMAWYKRHRPDVIISVNAWPLEWLREAGISMPETVGLALVSVANTECAGVDSRPARQGERIAEMAEILIHQRIIRFNPSDATLRMHVPGAWRDGTTLRPKSPCGDHIP
ncbi:MAG: LacI family DNA-binding transcriptional regulator [Verrucomicrobia bacterium]|nr:LacI family DNA-binding transcriptional regulator [Verrucomicrobiota bacterium]MCH8514622.1 LacI family transcriptional regulator [Kiritimatiellia bacterium]